MWLQPDTSNAILDAALTTFVKWAYFSHAAPPVELGLYSDVEPDPKAHVRNGGSQNDGHQGIAVGVQIRHIDVKDFATIECEKPLPKVMEDATLQDGSAVEPEV